MSPLIQMRLQITNICLVRIRGLNLICETSRWKTYEPAHDKTYNNSCMTSKDSDQPVHSPSMAMVFVYPYFDNPEVVEGTRDR